MCDGTMTDIFQYYGKSVNTGKKKTLSEIKGQIYKLPIIKYIPLFQQLVRKGTEEMIDFVPLCIKWLKQLAPVLSMYSGCIVS